MSGKILIALLIAGSSVLVYPQKKLTIDDAIKIAHDKNITLNKTLENEKNYEQNIKQSYGNLLPNFNANLGLTTSSRKNAMAGSSSGTNYEMGLSSQWVLFDGLSNLKTLEKNQKNMQSFQNQIERLKQDIAYQVSTLYYAVLTQYNQMLVLEENMKWNQKNYELVKEKYNLGSASSSDLYSQELKVGTAEFNYIQAKNQYAAQKDELIDILGLDVLENYELESPTADLDSLSITNESNKYNDVLGLYDTALLNRVDYKNKKLDKEISIIDQSIAKGNYYPSLSANWNLNYNADKFGDITKYYTHSFGLTLSIPIFSGFTTETQVEAAKVSTSIKDKELTELERQIKVNLKKASLDLQNTKEKYIVSLKNVRSAEETKKVIEERYKLGAETLLNVLIAENDYVTAKSQKITAVFDYYKNLAQVKYYIGK